MDADKQAAWEQCQYDIVGATDPKLRERIQFERGFDAGRASRDAELALIRSRLTQIERATDRASDAHHIASFLGDYLDTLLPPVLNPAPPKA